MFRPRTLKILALIVAGYVLILLPGQFYPRYLDTPVGILLLLPILSVYVFHNLGVPGLVENNGLCGWGMCPPTPFGWTIAAIVWLVPLWLLAWGIGSISAARNID